MSTRYAIDADNRLVKLTLDNLMIFSRSRSYACWPRPAATIAEMKSEKHAQGEAKNGHAVRIPIRAMDSDYLQFSDLETI